MIDWQPSQEFSEARSRAIREKERSRKNTPLAQRLAKIYEEHFNEPFPGGIENACIQRTYAGHHQRSGGAWSWCLQKINSDIPNGLVRDFGSQYPAKEAVKDPMNLILVYNGFRHCYLGENL